MREGLIPTLLGTGVTAAATVMRVRDMRKRGMRKRDMVPMAQTALLGFGLAHIILGAIDMAQHRR
ncbi:MAG: asparagine synthase [Bacillota bacterium]